MTFFDELTAATAGVEAEIVLDEDRRPVGRIIFRYEPGLRNLRAFVQVWGPVFVPGDEVRTAVGAVEAGNPDRRTEAVTRALAQLRPGTGVEPDWALAAFIAAEEALQADPERDYAEALEAQGLRLQYVL
jgi:hypothetical protein